MPLANRSPLGKYRTAGQTVTRLANANSNAKMFNAPGVSTSTRNRANVISAGVSPKQAFSMYPNAKKSPGRPAIKNFNKKKVAIAAKQAFK